LIEALRASPCLSSNCAVAPCRAPPPHLLAASIAPHAARRLNRAEASHQPSLGRALALHPRSISLSHRFPAATVRALAHSPARPSIRPFVRPSTRSRLSSLSLSLSLSSPLLSSPLFRVLSHGRVSSRFLFPSARTTNRRSLGYSDARLPLSLSSSRHPARAQQGDVRCVGCAALRITCVRLCALRSARGRAQPGARAALRG